MTVIDVTSNGSQATESKARQPSPGPPSGETAGEAVRLAESREHVAARYVFAATRISIGFIFLWAFFDKLFGWGKATPSAGAWINGGSPTAGFLKGVQGPFADTFHSIAGATWADWLFMVGLLGVGLALTLGIGMRIAAASGSVLLALMWLASLPLKTNPFMDDHLIYGMVIVGLALIHAGETFGLGKVWAKLPIVRRFPVLR